MSYTISVQRYRRTARGQRRRHAPTGFGGPVRVEFGNERFRVRVERVRREVALPAITLDDLATSVTWRRNGARTTGTLEMQDPDDRVLPGLLVRGDVVRLEVDVRGDGLFRPLWELECARPEHSYGSGTRTVALRTRLRESRMPWKFRTDRAHPKGWTADQITRFACERAGVPVGPLPKGEHRFKRLTEASASWVEVVARVWKAEREESGRRFDMNISRGRCEVTELRRPAYMLALGQELIDAVVSETLGAQFASAVVVTSTTKLKGGKRRKVSAKVIDRARVRRYGYVLRKVEKPGLATTAEARAYGKKWLARTAKPKQTVTVTAPGLPFLDRGDAMEVHVKEAELRAEVYVASVEHSLAAGSYTMDVTFTVNDPWSADERKRRNVLARRDAARRRGRHGGDPPTPRKPARAERRR